MTWTTHMFALLAVLPVYPANAWALESGDVPDRAQLLKILRAKDAQFDNARLDYVTWGTLPARSKSSWLSTGDQDRERPRTPFRFDEQLVVRGENTTFIRRLNAGFSRLHPDVRLVPFQKWSDAGGLTREITESSSSRNMDILQHVAPVTLMDEQRMMIEFSHGFGFGKRIKDISAVRSDGSSIMVEGTMQVWAEDVSRFTLELDAQFVVQKCVIDCDVRGNLNSFDITTEGLIERGGFAFARRGHVKRTWQGLIVNGKKTGEPEIINEFNSEFLNVHFGLSDNEYANLVVMEATPGTVVTDKVIGKTYLVQADGTAKLLWSAESLLSDERSPTWTKWLALNTAVLVLAVSAMVVRELARRRRVVATDGHGIA